MLTLFEEETLTTMVEHSCTERERREREETSSTKHKSEDKVIRMVSIRDSSKFTTNPFSLIIVLFYRVRT